MSPGIQDSANGAAAPAVAGARLEAMRRRVHLSRMALWTVMATGPIALGFVVVSTPPTAQATVPGKPTGVRTVVAAEPDGYAQLFLSAWLRSSADDATSAQARLAQSLAPGVDLPAPDSGVHRAPQSVTVLRSVQGASGSWSVTVAVQYAGSPVRYYMVPVAYDAAQTAFAVTGAPGEVAGPARARPAESPYAVTVPQGDLSSAVGEFLSAYLTGAGQVDRYLAPGVHLSAVSPAPYSAVTVEQVLSAEEAAAAAKVPADGSTVRVAVRVLAQDAGDRWPLAYELTLRARSGRWEVAALGAGTAQSAGAR
ncbi:conjugal transfer protein [Streptomyces sp. NPDC094468]|uniref:conjugal transfer protein n=1 Tax=Streptomyces sp. NPDC094468 TaxID=3366066 RepID=UPI00381119E2